MQILKIYNTVQSHSHGTLVFLSFMYALYLSTCTSQVSPFLVHSWRNSYIFVGLRLISNFTLLLDTASLFPHKEKKCHFSTSCCSFAIKRKRNLHCLQGLKVGKREAYWRQRKSYGGGHSAQKSLVGCFCFRRSHLTFQ